MVNPRSGMDSMDRVGSALRGIVLPAAAFAIALSTGVACDEKARTTQPFEPPSRLVEPQGLNDSHGYPRTYHLYSGGPIHELARYDMLVEPRWVDIRALRRQNPRGIFLLQPTLAGSGGRDFVQITSPGGAIGWAGATDRHGAGRSLGRIRGVDPEWDLLHNDDGSTARIGKIFGWNLAAPPDKGVPTEVAKIFAYGAKRDGLYCTVRIDTPHGKKRVPCWNGVHSDNWIYSAIGAGWFYGPKLDANRDGSADEANVLRRNWSNGLTRAGMLLRSYLPGKIVGGNGVWYRPELYAGTDPKGWLKASNYTLVEHMQNFSTPTLLSTAKSWLSFRDPRGQPRYMAALMEATDADGKPLFWRGEYPNTPAAMRRSGVLRSMRWGLTLSLMTGMYYEIIGDWKGNPIDCRWWFDEFDGGVGVHRRGYLGRALGPYKQIGDGVYRRDFRHGIAINNSSSKTQTIALGDTFKKLRGTQDPSLNNGGTVSSITVPAKDGIILLRS
jgi:hypothetical protein